MIAPDGKVQIISVLLNVAPNFEYSSLVRGTISFLSSGKVLLRNTCLNLGCSCHLWTIPYISRMSDLPEPAPPRYAASLMEVGIDRNAACLGDGFHSFGFLFMVSEVIEE
jgi:hypothetical protein